MSIKKKKKINNPSTDLHTMDSIKVITQLRLIKPFIKINRWPKSISENCALESNAAIFLNEIERKTDNEAPNI